MSNSNEYTDLIAGFYKHRPRFEAFVFELTEPLRNARLALAKLREDFDLDKAVGVQLDAIGVRVGITRTVNLPISGVFFGYDESDAHEWEGLDIGVWKGENDSTSGVAKMGDEIYRAAIRSKILINKFDGTTGMLFEILPVIFENFGSSLDEISEGAMSVTASANRTRTSSFVWELISQRVLDCIPAGVTFNLVNSSGA